MSLGWYPIVNYELCTGCGVCYAFCPHAVYEWNEPEENPLVVQPQECIQGCHGCENKCPAQAIRYFGDLPGKQSGGAYRLEF
ncbi:MAG TPA: ferredoxin family protein [Syntrophomonas sp.]|nr:ferredoxin family protein [Syntrophomonas sp.]